MTLGEYLREVRLDRAITQKEAAEALGISKIYYSNLETDTHSPGIVTIKRLSEFYGIPTTLIRQLIRGGE